MPTPLNNQASIRYSYNNNTGTGAASSNTVTTNLLDRYTLTAAKTSLTPTFRPGENVTYILRVENSGSDDLYNITAADNLGGGGDTAPLVYNAASLRAYLNGDPVPVTPTAAEGALTAVIPGPLPAGGTALLVYTAKVREDLDRTVQSITNTAAVTANGGSAAGPAVTASPAPTATILRDSYADLSLYKEGDKQNIMSGDTLTYTFTLTNDGDLDAENVTLTDTLPAGFAVKQVSVTSGGTTTMLTPADYTVAADNTITIPSAAGTAIRVPAATAAAPGIATVEISGVVTA